MDLWYDVPIVSEDGKHATRTIHARLGESAEVQHTLVTYNLLVGSARDMHRLREEAAIRSLDTAAAAAHRAKKTELAQLQRPARAANRAADGR